MRIKRSLSAIIATIFIAAVPLAASAQFSVGIGFTIGVPPPPIPYYAQPPAPYPNYQWTPGYWAWGPAGYYWVPGTWVAAPAVGLYWTPGYWGYNNGYYGWNAGYWGATVGFYGGINYGYGYPGTGFYGGAWNGGNFAYNTAVTNVNKTVIHNTYNKTVINKGNFCNGCKNVSYNGGKGGVSAKPTEAQINARRNGRAPTSAQKDQATIAGQDRNQLASVNKGKPSLTSSQKPFSSSNKPSNFAPVTTADKQNAAKTYKMGATQTTNKAPATTNKAPATTNKAPATQHKQPGNEPMKKQSTNQPTHKQPPSNNMQGAHTQGNMQQGGMSGGHPSGGGHPQGGGKPPGGEMQGQAHPQGGGKPPGGEMQGQAHPQGSGKPPGGNDKNKPPRHEA